MARGRSYTVRMPEKPAARHHRPVKFSPAMFDQREGGTDPETLSQAAHTSAWALLTRGRANRDPEVTVRLVEFTDRFGVEALAQMWAQAPAASLPGALWRIHALRDTVRRDPARIGEYYRLGQDTAEVSRVVAGVADPPDAEEVCRTVDEILTGAYTGQFDVALERFAAFCRVIALGQSLAADRTDAAVIPHRPGAASEFFADPGSHPAGTRMTRASRRLIGTAEQLEAAAAAWRAGTLD